MAFDRDDTDRLYDKAIEPLLKRCGVVPFRVDRSDRNDDIDEQIMSGLKECDLVLADLTYARPSVYFEAGVAHGRPVPVIFTCRKDHFKHQPNDPHGNCRIHFDLQMKPIIKWDVENIRPFDKQLYRRVNNIIRPLLKQKQRAKLNQDAIAAFSPLSLSEKLKRLEDLYLDTIQSLGFNTPERYGPAWKIEGRPKALKWTMGEFFNSPSKRDLSSLRYTAPHRVEGSLKELLQQRNPPKVTFSNVFIFSLQKVPRSRIAAAFHSFRVHEEFDRAVVKTSVHVSIDKYPKRKTRHWIPPKKVTVLNYLNIYILSGIKHDGELRNQIENILGSRKYDVTDLPARSS